MNVNTCPYINIIIFTVPIGFECDWDTIPSLGINVSESLPHAFNNSLDQDMRLKINVNSFTIIPLAAYDGGADLGSRRSLLPSMSALGNS